MLFGWICETDSSIILIKNKEAVCFYGRLFSYYSISVTNTIVN